MGFGKEAHDETTEVILKKINMESDIQVRKSTRSNKGKSVFRYEGYSLSSDEF